MSYISYIGATVTVAGQVFYNTENILQEALHMNNGKGLSGSMRGKKAIQMYSSTVRFQGSLLKISP